MTASGVGVQDPLQVKLMTIEMVSSLMKGIKMYLTLFLLETSSSQYRSVAIIMCHPVGNITSATDRPDMLTSGNSSQTVLDSLISGELTCNLYWFFASSLS